MNLNMPGYDMTHSYPPLFTQKRRQEKIPTYQFSPENHSYDKTQMLIHEFQFS